ncbi:MAG: hypothetical protein GY810_24125 [Aureispira sp.]|nr:hypothetical protein [Aureispira sp.]
MRILMFLGLVLFARLELTAQTANWTRGDIQFVYSNYENELFLEFDEVDTDELELIVSSGTISIKDGKYAWKPANAGKIETLTVKANGKVINSFEFKVVRFSDPVISVVPVQKANNKTFKGLKAESTSDAYNIPVQVEAYVIEIKEKGREVVALYNNGAVIEPRHKKVLEKASEDAMILFTVVRARCPGDKVSRRLPNMRLQ